MATVREIEARKVLKKYVKIAETKKDDPRLHARVKGLFSAIHKNKTLYFGYGLASPISKTMALDIHEEIVTHINKQAKKKDAEIVLSTKARIGAKTKDDKPFIIFSTGGSKSSESKVEGIIFLMYLFMLVGHVKQFSYCHSCGKILMQIGQKRKTCGSYCRVSKFRQEQDEIEEELENKTGSN